MEEQIIQRFWSKVDKSGGEAACWNWTGAVTNYGYGIFVIRHGQFIHANRFALIASGIGIQDNQHACHRCDNRRCCNPSHLFVGTASENEQDKIVKGRHRYGTRRGEQSNFAKLTQSQVDEIRSSTSGRRALAEQFGVHVSTISRIRRGVHWRS